jgi:hypothetical protein
MYILMLDQYFLQHLRVECFSKYHCEPTTIVCICRLILQKLNYNARKGKYKKVLNFN